MSSTDRFQPFQPPVLSDLSELRQHIDLSNEGLYLDHAAAGLLPIPAARAMHDRIESAQRFGVRHWNTWMKLVQRTRRLAADLMGGREDEVAFVPNTASGIGTVAEGYPWKPGDNVVLPAAEFPSNRVPWKNLKRRGVEVREVSTGVPGSDFYAAVEQACDDHTRIVACSWIDYATGIRRDPARLSAIAHRHQALLVLDVIQGLGVLPVDLHAQQIDILTADSRKWLMGPEGAGLLAIRRECQDRLQPTRPGWASCADPMNFVEPNPEFAAGATRFESGMPNTFGLTGLHASVKMLSRISLQQRGQRLLEVRPLFVEACREAGWSVPDIAEEQQSGLISVTDPRRSASDVVRSLRQQQVSVSLKNDAIRISPHLYNTAEDAAVLLEKIRTTA